MKLKEQDKYLEDLVLDDLSVVSNEADLEFAGAGNDKVGSLVLIGVSVSSDDDRLCPGVDETGHVLDNDWLSEDSSSEDVSDSSVGTFPHLLQLKLFYSSLIGGDCGTLDGHIVL